MFKRFRIVVSSLALLAITAHAAAQLQPTSQELFDASVRVLRSGVNPITGGPDLAVLGSLRELNDASLKPLWYQLAQQERWEAQVHAVLALSELSPDNPADGWMIAQLRSTDAQRAVIATLLDRKTLSAEQARKLLESDVLDPVTELWLLADLVGRGEAINQSRLREIATSGDIDLEGLAVCLLAQLGDESMLAQHAAKVAELKNAMRNRHLLELFIAIEQYKLTASLVWMHKLVNEVEIERAVRWQATHAMLMLAPSEGVAMWREAAAGVESDNEWLRALLLLLDGGADVPADTYRIVPRDNELIAAVAAIGDAMSNGQPLAQPIINVIDMGQSISAHWALGRAETLDKDEARTVLLHVIDNILARPSGRDDRTEMAVIATEQLYKIDPQATLAHLLKVEDDGLTQEVMLLGLMRCHGEDIGAAAAQLHRIGHSRADSMTLLLIARQAEKLSETELKQLGLVASGGSRLTTALQAQAAWLYLKFSRRTEQALNRIFAKE